MSNLPSGFESIPIDRLVDPSLAPAVEHPDENSIIKAIISKNLLVSNGHSFNLDALVGEPMQLLNVLLLQRDQQSTIPDIWRGGFRSDLTAVQVRPVFERNALRLGRMFERDPISHGDISLKIMRMKRLGSRVVHQLNPSIVFYDESLNQTSPTWQKTEPRSFFDEMPKPRSYKPGA